MEDRVYTFKDNIKLIKEYKETKSANILEIILIVNYSLLRKQARKYSRLIEGTCLVEEDLIQVGYIGLMKAVEKFDVNKEVSFSTYALYWIKQYMTREVSDRKNLIRIPVYMIEQMLKIRHLEEELENTGEDLDVEKIIMDKIGIDREKYKEIKEIETIFGGSLISLDMEIGEEDSISLSELVTKDESEDIVFDTVYYKDLKESILKALSTLSEREADILKLRYGMYNGEEETLDKIGKQYNLSRERIRQIEKKALWKLRHKKVIRDIEEV